MQEQSFSKYYLHHALSAGRATEGEANPFAPLSSFGQDPPSPETSRNNYQWEVSLGLHGSFCSTQEWARAGTLLGPQDKLEMLSPAGPVHSQIQVTTLTTHPRTTCGWSATGWQALAKTVALKETVQDQPQLLAASLPCLLASLTFPDAHPFPHQLHSRGRNTELWQTTEFSDNLLLVTYFSLEMKLICSVGERFIYY